MTRAVGPRAGLPSDALVPFVIIGACWVPAGAASAVWVGGHAASAVTGHGWAGPPFSVDWALRFAADGPGPSWPAVPGWLVWAVSVALAAAVTVPVLFAYAAWRRRQRRPGDPLGALARPADLAGFAPAGATAGARRLRPSLAPTGKQVAGGEVGVPIGRLRPAGPALWASWEDVHVVFMAPRTGKTSCLSVPQVLAGPGAVVATSNKADLWALTAAARAADTGEPVWVFDPQRIAFTPQTWWWNPLAGVTTVEAAQRLTGHFMVEVRGSGRDQETFWTSAAEDVLASLFLAAGLARLTLADVYDWLNRPTSPVPVDLLRAHGQPAAANGLAGRQAGAADTREGIFETARTAAKCLRDPQIMAWVTPPAAGAGFEEFRPAGFAATRQTLYLLTKDTAGGAAPLVAAFADRVMHDAVTLAERRGGRLDPPLLVVLDEAANVCKIADLPRLYSHLGSRGIIPVTILQSYPQGESVWGKTGMETLWSAATVKLVGPGLDDDAFLERVSRLVGDHDVPLRALHYGSGSNGENISLRRQRILPPEELRQLSKGTAVLFTTGARPALIDLEPWYRGPRAAELTAASDAALAALTARAQQEVPA